MNFSRAPFCKAKAPAPKGAGGETGAAGGAGEMVFLVGLGGFRSGQRGELSGFMQEMDGFLGGSCRLAVLQADMKRYELCKLTARGCAFDW